MLRIAYITFMCLFFFSCTTPNKESTSHSVAKPVVHEANITEDQVSSFLQIEQDNPKAIEIMQQTCNGQYQIIEEDANTHGHNKQVEVGLTKSIGKSQKTKPYIRYTCVRSR